MKNVYLLSFLILFSCSEKEEQNDNIVPRDQFSNILEQIYLVESDFKLNGVNNSDYQEILSDYNVSNTNLKIHYIIIRKDQLY